VTLRAAFMAAAMRAAPPLAGLDLGGRVDDLWALGLGKAVDGLALRFESEPGRTLFLRATRRYATMECMARSAQGTRQGGVLQRSPIVAIPQLGQDLSPDQRGAGTCCGR
jgi:hypothetical protein